MIESSSDADAEMSPTKVLTLLLGAGALGGTTSTANAVQAPTSMDGGVVARDIPGPGIARTGPAIWIRHDVGPNNDNDLLRDYPNDNDLVGNGPGQIMMSATDLVGNGPGMPGYIVGTMKGKVVPTNLKGAMTGKVVPTNLKVGPNNDKDLRASLTPTDNNLPASLTPTDNDLPGPADGGGGDDGQGGNLG